MFRHIRDTRTYQTYMFRHIRDTRAYQTTCLDMFMIYVHTRLYMFRHVRDIRAYQTTCLDMFMTHVYTRLYMFSRRMSRLLSQSTQRLKKMCDNNIIIIIAYCARF
jgi:hypothetical protein